MDRVGVFAVVGRFALRRYVLWSALGCAWTATPTVRTADCNHNGVDDALDLEPRSTTLSIGRAYEVGVTPRSIFAVDVDHDGALDLVTADRHSNRLSVLRNLGDGTLAEAASVPVENPASLTAFDADGDGLADLAYVSTLASVARIRRGSLAGGFLSPEEHSLGGQGSVFVTSGDVDLDGKADIVALNRFENRVTVLFGEGGGDFGVPVLADLPVGSDPLAAALLDLEGDRDLDIAVAAAGVSQGGGATTGGTALVGNLGARAFDVPRSLGGLNPLWVAAADLEGDGDQDLVVAEGKGGTRLSGALETAANDGNGKLSRRVVAGRGGPPSSFHFVAAADLSGDGRPEALVLTSAREVIAYSNGGEGQLHPDRRGGTAVLDSVPRVATTVDLDGDGAIELAVASHEDDHTRNGVTVLRRQLAAASRDENGSGVPDECEEDCDGSGALDSLEIARGEAEDRNRNGRPDTCDPPGFNLSFDGPRQLAGNPGATLKATYDCVMTPVGAFGEGGDGAQGWSIGGWVDGLRVTEATLAGTIVGGRTDGPPAIAVGFEVTELASDGARLGFISAVVISKTQAITLPTDRLSFICKVTVEGEAPGLAEPRDARLMYADGLRGTRHPSPVQNRVTRLGATIFPFLLPLRVAIFGQPPAFRRGDANGDGRLDISDSVRLISHLFLGAEAPGCLEAADADDSGAVDLTDALFMNLYLFVGQSAPPAPGPAACGADPTPDALTCLEQSECR